MKRGVGCAVLWLLPALVAGLLVGAPGAVAAPGCVVEVRPVALPVDGEQATGRVYEPRGCAGGPPDDLVVAGHGHNGSSAQYAEYLMSIARRTATPILAMDMRGAGSAWRTGEWNIWAGWRDLVAATQWYRAEHPSITRTVLWGWSQGAITTGLAAAHGPRGLFDYWIDTFGPAETFSYWLGPAADDRRLRAQIERDAGGCVPLLCPQAYAERSPALLAGRLGVRRAFVIHGTADPIVPYTSALEMRAALLAAGKPTSMYTVVTGRDLNGAVVPGDHSVGPVLFEGGCVVERLLLGTEPVHGGDRDYLIDVAGGTVTAPPAPPGAKCAA